MSLESLPRPTRRSPNCERSFEVLSVPLRPDPCATLTISRSSGGDIRCDEAMRFLQGRGFGQPCAALVLGTGLGPLAAQIQAPTVIRYADVPHFPRATALGHAGRLIYGRLGSTPIIAMDGRFHFYEGYGCDEITLPIAVMKALGAEFLILSNASGGLNPQFRSGDVMALADHINLMGRRTAPLTTARAQPSRSGQASPYDPRLIEVAQQIARESGFACHRGTYVAVLGPNYETRAEYRALRRMGGDAVGMSTVPEVLAAMRCELPVLALSTITNTARPDAPTSTDPREVLQIASQAEPRLREIILGVLRHQFAGRAGHCQAES